MQTDIDIEEIREFVRDANNDFTYGRLKHGEHTQDYVKALGIITKLLSLLPPPCSTCGGSGEKLEWVPTHEGSRIKKPGKIPCPCQAPASEIEEFVKTFRRWLKALGTTDITNNQVRVKGYQACNLLTEQAKTIAAQDEDIASFQKDLMISEKRGDQLEAKASAQAKRIEELEADLADIKLELSTPETIGMEKEPLYKWAATVMCAKLQQINKLQAKITTKDGIIDGLNQRLDDIGGQC